MRRKIKGKECRRSLGQQAGGKERGHENNGAITSAAAANGSSRCRKAGVNEGRMEVANHTSISSCEGHKTTERDGSQMNQQKRTRRRIELYC